MNIKNVQCNPSPLRYPGGKGRAVKQIIQYIPSGTPRVVSPFIGGGSVEIALSRLGVEVLGFDVFDPLVCFWRTALCTSEQLAEAAAALYPVTKEIFQALRASLPHRMFDKALNFYVLNRTSYGGSSYSGGYTGDRFTEGSIKKLRDFQCHGLRVEKKDFRRVIPQHQNDFLYLDPPYFNQKNPLYGKNGSTHKGFPHQSLANLLLQRDGWLLSYDDCPEIRKMYYGCRIVKPRSWGYSLASKKDRKFRDILIMKK